MKELAYAPSIRAVEDAFVEDTLLNKELLAAITSPRYLVHEQFANTYANISNTYAESEFGVHHATQLRRFMQSDCYPYSPGGNYRQTLKDLGDDIHPLLHMQHTHRYMAVPYLKGLVLAGELIAPHEVATVRIAAETHDIGENTHPSLPRTTGDLPHGTKKAEHNEVELEVWDHIIATTGILGVLPKRSIPVLRDIVAEADADTPAAEHFEYVEQCGYYATAGQAALTALRIDRPTPRRAALEKLAEDVSCRAASLRQSPSLFAARLIADLEPLFEAQRSRQLRRRR